MRVVFSQYQLVASTERDGAVVVKSNWPKSLRYSKGAVYERVLVPLGTDMAFWEVGHYSAQTSLGLRRKINSQPDDYNAMLVAASTAYLDWADDSNKLRGLNYD